MRPYNSLRQFKLQLKQGFKHLWQERLQTYKLQLKLPELKEQQYQQLNFQVEHRIKIRQ
jgi:hypothetical protein